MWLFGLRHPETQAAFDRELLSPRVVAAEVLGGQVARDGDGPFPAQRTAPAHVPGDVVCAGRKA